MDRFPRPWTSDQRDPCPPTGASPIPERIAAVRMFNLDHVRAVVREQPSGEGPRDQGPELEDANAAQGSLGLSGGASLRVDFIGFHILDWTSE